MSRTLTAVFALSWSCATVIAAQSPAPADLELLNAVNRGQCRDVEGLLRKKANPNARDDEGATALIRAALFCEARVLTQLLDRGAHINAADAQGRTPLMMAIERDPPDRDFARRQMEVLKLLLSRKADPAMKDADSNTMVHYAARQRNVEVLKMMLALGVPADARNKDGATALFVAAADGRELPNVQALIAAGADVNSADNHGMTVLAVAREADIVNLLTSRGARAETRRPPARPAATPVGDPRAPIAGVTFEQWARANGRLAAEVPFETAIAPLKLDKARWDQVQEQWTERLAANLPMLSADYAKIFRTTMEEEAARRGEPGTTPGGSPEPIPFERWVEIQEASSAASDRVPVFYGLSRPDFTRVQSWWDQRLKAKEVDRALYDRLSAKYEKQFAAAPPVQQSRPVLREGALENNREPVSLEQWVELQQAAAAAQTWTLKKHGLTMGQWIRATGYWGKRFNEALLTANSGTPAEQAAKRQMRAEQLRLSELYRKKYAQGVPW